MEDWSIGGVTRGWRSNLLALSPRCFAIGPQEPCPSPSALVQAITDHLYKLIKLITETLGRT